MSTVTEEEVEVACLLAASDQEILCNTRKTPTVLGGLFLELTRMLYLSEDSLYKHVKTWSPNNEINHTYVELSNVWDDANTDRRPAIIVDIGDLQITPIDSLFGRAQSINLREGTEHYERVVAGTVVWAHLNEKRGESVLYGSNSYDLLDGFSPVICRDFGFEKFNVTSILKPRLRKEKPKDWEVLVQAAFQFRENFELKRESPKLKQITLKAEAGLDQSFNLVR